MTLVSSKTIKKIFLTTDTKVNNITEKVSVILSPEFYWVRMFDIPVKTEKQAKNLLPTLFEDIIKEKDELTYQVIKKDENLFLCFAYNDKSIYEAIKKANIPITNIVSVHFAQNECKTYEKFEIDNQKYIYTNDDILIKVPYNMVDETIVLNNFIDKIKLTPYKLPIKLYNNFFDTKFYYSIFVVMFILIITNLVKYVSYSKEVNKLEDEIQKTRVRYNLPSSNIQTKSILSRYNSALSKEKTKRELISYIFSNNKLNLNSLIVEDDGIELEYLSTNKNEVETFLRKKFKTVVSKQNAQLLKVSVKL